MRLNQEQYTKLQSVFISAGLSLEAFDERWKDDEYYFSYKMEPSICFTIHRSIQGNHLVMSSVIHIHIKKQCIWGAKHLMTASN